MSNIKKAFTPLFKADFTITNQGTATLTDFAGGITFSMPGRANNNSAILLTKAVPSTPYIIEANVQNIDYIGGWELCGLIWKKGDLLQSVGWMAVTGAINNYNNRLGVDNWNKYDNYSGAVVATTPPPIWDGRWLRIRDDGTNRYGDISRDGTNWTNVYSVARGYWFTDAPTHVGLIINNYSNGSTPFKGTIAHYKVITSG
jgi:hypothetical protein